MNITLHKHAPLKKRCVSLVRHEKKNFCSNLDTKVVTDNSVFWKFVEPLLYEKVTKHSKINLAEDGKNISRNDQIAEKFSEYFIFIAVLNMSINGYKWPDSSEQDPILKILGKYKEHSSIKLIKAKNNSEVFKFSQIDIEEVKKVFQSLDPIKDFLQSKQLTISVIQFTFQNFPTNRNKRPSYLQIRKFKTF